MAGLPPFMAIHLIEHKSTITDHADRYNCVIDWEGAKVVDKETNRCARLDKRSHLD